MSRLKTSNLKTLSVAFLVALICSVVVSFTAVTLKPLQDANRLRASSASLVEVLQTLGVGMPKTHLVDRVSGASVRRDPGSKSELGADKDIAGLGWVENVLTVYELRTDGRIDLVILPVRGTGYKSMLEGYLVLEKDLNTIAALTFHKQDETPGMGARIMEKEWQALWADKQVSDQSGTIRIEVVKGAASDVHEVDGISGATRTGRGVSNLMRFWFGPDGYGPYLARLKREAG